MSPLTPRRGANHARSDRVRLKPGDLKASAGVEHSREQDEAPK